MSPKIPEDQKGRVKELIQQFEAKGRAGGERGALPKKPGVAESKGGHVAAARAKLKGEGLFAADRISDDKPPTIAAPGRNEGVKASIAGLEPPKEATQPIPSAPTAPPPPPDILIPPAKKPGIPEIKEGHVAAAKAKLKGQGLFAADGSSDDKPPAIATPGKDEGGKASIAGLEPPKGATQPIPSAPIAPPPPADIPIPPAPPADIPKGTKFGKKKVMTAPMGETQGAEVKLSHIRSENGNEYIVSNTQAKGGFGKFRYAVDMAGQRWAVKEFRSEEARFKPTPKTYITQMNAIKAEIETMQAVGASLTVKDVINIKGKVYAVMPIMSGEVRDLIEQLGSADKQCVARSVLRQMAEDLGKCHHRGYVHRDVKLPNALWNPDGKVAVADFGVTVKAPVGEERLRGLAGTPGYMGPEMYNGQGHDAKIDTWSLALSVAEVHIPWNECPFTSAPWQHWGNLRDGQETRLFADFAQWRKGLITPGGLDTGLIGKDPQTTWDTYFSRILTADPVLCEYMLSRMLVNDPAERASMDEVKAFMDKVQSATSPGETQAKLAFNQSGGDTQKKDAVFKLLEKDRLAFSPDKSPIKQALTKARRWVRRLKIPF